MMLHIRHETRYEYAVAVHQSVQSLRLTPRRERGQRTLSWRMSAPGRRTEQLDAHGNISHLLTVDEPHRDITIIVEGVVDVLDEGPLIFERGPIAPLAYLASTPLTAADEAIAALAAAHLPGSGADGAALLALASAVRAAVQYRPGTTTVADTAVSALRRAEGVCQDQAHVFLACCRAARVPARYVSGYLLAGSGDDAASHAWVDVWQEAQGAWLGLDVTHACLVGADHCRLAVGRDYLDAAPVRGVRRGGGNETLEVNVHVAVQAGQQ
ncbi:MAG TPA: transglutaminase family protein [Steroidobacteraceae bacterium]|nr:transglutaminase family protein [Steroidobacteraceae bacterium]